MKAYKATYDLKCRDQQYEVGQTYKINKEIRICKTGFHFCYDIKDTLNYYDIKLNLVIIEIEILSNNIIIDDDKLFILTVCTSNDLFCTGS